MTLRDKIERLHKIGDLVLFRWMTGKHRVAQSYVMLSMLRFEVLICTKDHIWFSSSAPCLYLDRGRPRIVMKDRDVLTISSGLRQGMTIIPSMLKPDETATETRHCRCIEVDETHCPKWLQTKVLAIGNAPVYPLSHIVMPELFRISKNPMSLRPFFSKEMMEDIGSVPGDSVQDMLDKFHSKLKMFGTFTDDGYIISNDLIATGGACVAQAKGLGINGSMVHQVTLNQFRQDMLSRHWKVGPDHLMKPKGTL